MVQLKSMTLPQVVQSPMAACTDLPFRLIARAHGMRFAFLEMLSAETLVRRPHLNEGRMETNAEDRPVGAQIVGCKPEVMADAARFLEDQGFNTIDLNLGCPVPKIVCNGGGSQLLKEPNLAGEIFQAVVRAVQRVPVTVKMRLGYNDASGQEAIQVARLAQDAGVSAVAIHGRTRSQGYSGQADYGAIRRVKESISIPVYGNGDVVDGPSAVRLTETSGCDGVMIGRGALGNPWIYREVECALEGKPIPPRPTLAEVKTVLLRHIELQCQYDRDPVGPLRRIICWYYKETPGAARFRNAIHHATSVEQMRQIIEETLR